MSLNISYLNILVWLCPDGSILILLEGTVLDQLYTLQFFSEELSTNMVFPSVHDAVLHCQCSSSRLPAASSEA